MKREVILFENEKGEDSIPKILLFWLNFLFIAVSFVGGRFMPAGVVLYPPIFIVSLIVSIYHLRKSIKNNTMNKPALSPTKTMKP